VATGRDQEVEAKHRPADEVEQEQEADRRDDTVVLDDVLLDVDATHRQQGNRGEQPHERHQRGAQT
jgi:hypothetical protein